MKIVYTKGHSRHDPAYQIAGFEKSAYPEQPVRIDTIAEALKGDSFRWQLSDAYTWGELASIHADGYLTYLRDAYGRWTAEGYSPDGVVPDTLAPRIKGRQTGHILNQAGWYCFDTSTPIVKGTFDAATDAAHAALTGADLLLTGDTVVYVLCRPPGHHAGADYCGGFCYLNNAALAVWRLSTGASSGVPQSRAAILDLDYHHGNGTQDVFYRSSDVLFASLHADPEFAYPYYWGFADQKGDGRGYGYTLNIPLPAGTDEPAYMRALDRALASVARFDPAFLVVSLGTDTYRLDPLGDFVLEKETFYRMGRMILALNRPVLVVQEGGYQVEDMGICVSNFLQGLL